MSDLMWLALTINDMRQNDLARARYFGGTWSDWRWLDHKISASLSEIQMKPKTLRAEGHVWNLSFGGILSRSIEFTIPISLHNFSCELLVRLANNAANFQNELDLASRHSMIEKQTLGYNPFSPALTGLIQVEYPDHPNDVSYALNEMAKDILYRQIASFLSFLQRRRVLFSSLHLDPSSGLMTFPIQAAAEYIDAVAYGQPAIPPSELQSAIQRYISWSSQSSPEAKRELLGVITRLSNLLNLPYSYERAEGYWRIVEAIGTRLPDTTESEALYDLVKAKIGMKKNSKTLLNAVRAISKSNSKDVDLIASCFNFRNEITHEYIDFDLIGSNPAGAAMNFLHGVCEAWVATTIGLNPYLLKRPTNSDIFGRVL